ncbi:hypothetical protein H6F74_16250 [Trichocoleus sp. FACHB-90]|uniref:DUF7453 family protein n=1 Tax=Cyanophyceae TaxID=3028117 RepID=UPI00168A1766|nr:choice-of-anchor tandem repeat NxxGxxAF-containing protein [Trichocoleus sp. FACHB-90]MBD1927783.1 hypothetical protein [Trichocoleus sp. FACHB-90]
MKLHLSLPAALMGLCLGLLGTGEAQAASFNFTKIADTNSSFSSFSNSNPNDNFFGSPALNNTGTVAFYAALDVGGEGIFTSNGTTTTTIVDTNNSYGNPSGEPIFNSFSSLSINDAKTVAFSTRLRSSISTTLIFKGEDETNFELVVIATPRDAVFFPSINNAGTVAFLEEFTGVFVQTRIPISNGGSISSRSCGGVFCQPIAPGVFESISIPMLNDAGTVAFRGSVYQSDNESDIAGGIFTGNDTPFSSEPIITTIADTSGIFRGFSDPSINNSGNVAFIAGLDTGSIGVFTGNGTTTTTIADSSGAFNSFFGTPSINDFGTVAFLAGLDVGGSGIFTGNNPLKDKVIVTGDTLFGSTVQELSFYREGLNNSGQVAFFASLANGTSGIFRADPIVVEPPKDVPEPAGLLGLWAVGVWSATSALKRKQKQPS